MCSLRLSSSHNTHTHTHTHSYLPFSLRSTLPWQTTTNTEAQGSAESWPSSTLNHSSTCRSWGIYKDNLMRQSHRCRHSWRLNCIDQIRPGRTFGFRNRQWTKFIDSLCAMLMLYMFYAIWKFVRSRKCIAQSWDHATIVRNLGIPRMCNIILRLRKFSDCAEHIFGSGRKKISYTCYSSIILYSYIHLCMYVCMYISRAKIQVRPPRGARG